MPSLPTERQQQIASFIQSESCRRGIAPTQREIAERFGFASTNSVRSQLRLMEKKGMLSRFPGKARGLDWIALLSVSHWSDISQRVIPDGTSKS